jgi:sec-independent protein translocase protein TatA
MPVVGVLAHLAPFIGCHPAGLEGSVSYASPMGGIGVPELLIVLAILLLIFGPKRLPTLGRQLGGGMREFKDSITGKSKDEDDEEEDANASARAALPEPAAPVGRAGTDSESTPAESDPAAPPRS